MRRRGARECSLSLAKCQKRRRRGRSESGSALSFAPGPLSLQLADPARSFLFILLRHFWNNSRYQNSVGPFHLALSSIRLSAPSGSPYPSSYPSTPPSHLNSSSSTDSYQTLNSALATLDLSRTAFSSSSSPPPKLIEPFSLLHPHVVVYLDPSHPSHSRPPASLTPHTLRTLLFGVERGMTTLSANRASLKSMWKVMEGRDPSLGVWGGEKLEAVGWVMDPRSLGEQMTME